ncbi:MAG: aspartate/glutamate racemase family protein [Thermoplasmata archaeon]|nr:aspartate/glutamate racemase family protein [Thermoplasmata archaeon]
MVEVIIVDPVKEEVEKSVREYIRKYYPQDSFSVVSIENGPETIESFTSKTEACCEILKNVDKMKNGDAVVINCFADPCLFELRENLDIPVFGAAETTMHMASLLGEFSVIGPGDNMISWVRIQAREYGVFEKLLSVKKVLISVKDILGASEKVYKTTKKAAIEAIDEGADVIVLGCTGFSMFAERLKDEIWNEYRIPVLEPLLTTYSVARSFLVSHGRRGLFAGK